MTLRSIVLLAALLALPASAQEQPEEGQFEEATQAMAAACVEPMTQKRLPECVLALERQILQLQAIAQDRGQRLKQLEDAVSIIAGNQISAGAFAHCHDSQPGCTTPLKR